MAKKKVPVIKFRFYAVAISLVLLIAGVVSFFVWGGFNTGIDFDSGLSQRVQIAPAGLEVSYNGAAGVVLSISGDSVLVEVRDANGVQNYVFSAAAYPTSADLAKGLNGVDGIKATVLNNGLQTKSLVSGFGFPAILGETPRMLNFSSGTATASIESVRSALSSLGNVKVQTVGAATSNVFQVRLGTEAGDTQASMEAKISNLLGAAFGNDSVVVLQSDFVGPKFSATLISSSLIAILVAMVLILIYIWVRFRFAYAVSSLIALVHDVLLMLAFIALFQFEISSTTIAAILTIIGYSLNNTIVIFDRIRENVKMNKELSMGTLIDSSVGQSLSRTMISSVTTILAVLPLAIFTTGDIRYFALNLMIGIVIGTYSSNFIAPALLYWITKAQSKRKGKKTPEMKAVLVEEASNVDVSDVGLVDNDTIVEIPTAERKLRGKRQQKK